MTKLYDGRGIHGETVATIGQRIVSGYYGAGDLLFIEALGAELKISRTALREAIKVLAAKGLVESRPKRGTVVRERPEWNLLDPDLIAWRRTGDPSPEFLNDLAEVRLIIEPAAARLAARRRTPDDLARLHEAVQAMTKAGTNNEASIEAHLAFHRSLLRASRNELLAEMEFVIEAWLRVRDELVRHRPAARDSVRRHRVVLESVQDQAPAAAARAMDDLLEGDWEEATKSIPAARRPGT
jgi:DNA-binding FadR family transcriptional regulator